MIAIDIPSYQQPDNYTEADLSPQSRLCETGVILDIMAGVNFSGTTSTLHFPRYNRTAPPSNSARFTRKTPSELSRRQTSSRAMGPLFRAGEKTPAPQRTSATTRSILLRRFGIVEAIGEPDEELGDDVEIELIDEADVYLPKEAMYGEAEPSALQSFSSHPGHALISDRTERFEPRSGVFPDLRHQQTSFGPVVVHRLGTPPDQYAHRSFKETCASQGRLMTGVARVNQANGGMASWMQWRGPNRTGHR
eukprot:m.31086 g.31086  ORF g.31086 m.31086 type:complete len:250 (+) comp12280_c0_seq1:31-780(+)